MSYITTYQKHRVDPIHMDEDLIDISDIAHALSLLCRANGHFPHFYSVAQHSVNCMNEARERGYSKRVQLGCLLHDASEAYLSDITRPVKPFLQNYMEIEAQLQTKIYQKWISPDFTEEESAQIRMVDDAMLYAEFAGLMGERVFETTPEIKSVPLLDQTDFKRVEESFLSAFYALT